MGDNTVFGFPIRTPYFSELNFFKTNKNVAGMATEDGHIILNPYTDLSEEEKAAVLKNEAARLYMRKNQLVPDFNVTPSQAKQFKGTAYEQDPLAMKQTIAARILSGDPSAGNITKKQKAWASELAKMLSGASGYVGAQ